MATQSLYRRYRPQKFSELKGQDHVVRALRDAVESGREGQAYLFSGPRGTGKTTSARILAKVLNCENVIGGEPCCECDSCLAVERGTSYDVHELDAASNNGVDSIRDLVEKASLGTPGRHKVYILDEVHMLSKAAEAALLKTLEEPPPHVVFVLATTDPQKMSDTIRSRTQHLQFHLLPTDTLAEHVKWVAEDAGYDISQAALDAALVQGGGSARDTLSALELLASTGGDLSDVIDLDEFMTALIEHDAGRALTAMGHAVSLGRDPRTITEDVIRHLRNSFLSLMAPELVVLPSERLDAVAAQAQQLGAAALVRAIETLGIALSDMRHAPDPRILVEVALVRLTSEEAGGDIDAVSARLGRLEAKVKTLDERGVAAAAPAAPVDQATGRAVLGGAARRPVPAAPAPEPAAAPAPGPAAAPAPEPAAAPAPAPAPAPAMSVPGAWESVKGQLKGLARALYAAGEFVGQSGDAWQFSVPNEPHGVRCAEHQQDVEAALSNAVGSPVKIEFVVSGRSLGGPGHRDTDSGRSLGGPGHRDTDSGRGPDAASDETPPPLREPAPEPPPRAQPTESGTQRAARAAAEMVDDEPDAPSTSPDDLPDDDDVDLDDLTDAPPESVKSPADRLAEAFPGSELMTDG